MEQENEPSKFEQTPEKVLEGLRVQKKTLTKWMNLYLESVNLKIDDLYADLSDGKLLLVFLEILSGEKLPKPSNGRMRIHKIQNVNLSLSFLQKKIRIDSIGAEDIVDGKPNLVLGLVWSIILHYQIQSIKISVNKGDIVVKKSGKDALLLWCQRKINTDEYSSVRITNFGDSWRSGLAFNALIHAHQPRLFDFKKLEANSNVANLNHAFNIANTKLGITNLLEAEDIDTSRPDEISIITYVASYYYKFMQSNQVLKISRKLTDIVNQLVDIDVKKTLYSQLIKEFLEQIQTRTKQLEDRSFPNSLEGMRDLLTEFRDYCTGEKLMKSEEMVKIEALYFEIKTVANTLDHGAFQPLQLQQFIELEKNWKQLEVAEHQREIALRQELTRQKKLEDLNDKFNRKAAACREYLAGMNRILPPMRYSSNLNQIEAIVKKHEAILDDILERKKWFQNLTTMAVALIEEDFYKAKSVKTEEESALNSWKDLFSTAREQKQSFVDLAAIKGLLQDADLALASARELRGQLLSGKVGSYSIEEVGREFDLQILRLATLRETERKLAYQEGSLSETKIASHKVHRHILESRIKQLKSDLDELEVVAEKESIVLEEARKFETFIKELKTEELWVVEQLAIYQGGIKARDYQAVNRLRQKYAEFKDEMAAHELTTEKIAFKGNSLIEEKHAKSYQISNFLKNLESLWNQLRESVNLKNKNLEEVSEVYQFNADADDFESWLNEAQLFVNSSDLGSDRPSTQALLNRHNTLKDQLSDHKTLKEDLNSQADRLIARGIDLPQFLSMQEKPNKKIEVTETQLVPIEVWEDEQVETIEYKTVTEERVLQQVKALYPFTGKDFKIVKGEVLYLLSQANPDWWSVRNMNGADGFVPANYVKLIEPVTLLVNVRKPEKVITTQRVKKTVLQKQEVLVVKPAPEEPVENLQLQEGIDERRQRINDSYDRLEELVDNRYSALQNTMKFYDILNDCDEFEMWMKYKEILLKIDESEDTAMLKFEQFGSSKLGEIEESIEEFNASQHPRIEELKSRYNIVRDLWENLKKLKEEVKLREASSPELSAAESTEEGSGLFDLQSEITVFKANLDENEDSTKIEETGLQNKMIPVWEEPEKKKEDIRMRLELASDYRRYQRIIAGLKFRTSGVKGQLSLEINAKDVKTAELLLEEHQQILHDVDINLNDLEEALNLNDKLSKSDQEFSVDIDTLDVIKNTINTIFEDWTQKDKRLKECIKLQQFNKEACRIDTLIAVKEVLLKSLQKSYSMESVEGIMEQHQEFERSLAGQKGSVQSFYDLSNSLLEEKHCDSEDIQIRADNLRDRWDGLLNSAAERRKQLIASLEYQRFSAEADDLDEFIEDNMQIVSDLTKLERKIQRHETLKKELDTKEDQLSNITESGKDIIAIDPEREELVTKRLEELQKKWSDLCSAVAEKDKKLSQIRDQQIHEKSLDDALTSLEDLRQSLEGTNDDVIPLRALINYYQTKRQEIQPWRQRILELQGAEACFGDNTDDIKAKTERAVQSLKILDEKMAEWDLVFKEGTEFHEYETSIDDKIQWIDVCMVVASSEDIGTNLYTARELYRKHKNLQAAIEKNKYDIYKELSRGVELNKKMSTYKDKVQELHTNLERSWWKLTHVEAERARKLEQSLKVHQFSQDVLDVESWIFELGTKLNSTDFGKDLDQINQLMIIHEGIELDIDTRVGVISELTYTGEVLIKESSGNYATDFIEKDKIQLEKSLGALQNLAGFRHKSLVLSLRRHEYYGEIEDLESQIKGQHFVASSEDYGKDFDHLLYLQNRFDRLQRQIEVTSERFNQCEDLVEEIINMKNLDIDEVDKIREEYGSTIDGMLDASKEIIDEVETRHSILRESLEKLKQTTKQRETKLLEACDIHRFYRDVNEALQLIQDKCEMLYNYPERTNDLNIIQELTRVHKELETDLLLLDDHLTKLSQNAKKLQELYPGGTAFEVANRHKVLWQSCDSFKHIRQKSLKHLNADRNLLTFLGLIRDLVSWSSELRANMNAEIPDGDVEQAQALKAQHCIVESEIESREDSVRNAMEKGYEIINKDHRSAKEALSNIKTLADEHKMLKTDWKRRLKELDQIIECRVILNEIELFNQFCEMRMRVLESSDNLDSCSIEEIEKNLKQHDNLDLRFGKFVDLKDRGVILSQQDHPYNELIFRELEKSMNRHKIVLKSCNVTRLYLMSALFQAQLTRDVEEVQIWIQGKMKEFGIGEVREISSLEERTNQLQKFETLQEEIVANKYRLMKICQLGDQLIELKGPVHGKPIRESIDQLRQDWEKLSTGVDSACVESKEVQGGTFLELNSETTGSDENQARFTVL